MRQIHDVVIIGSGASGGMAAYTLTRMGVKCLMLEAGPMLDVARQKGSRAVYDLPYRGFGEPGRFPHVTQASEFDANLWADEKQNPYTYDPSDPYFWVRMRLLGGKTLRWGRWSLRLSDMDLKAKDHDGFGENWPISYADLAPFYNRIEPLFRVSGRKEGLPQLPDGIFIEDNSRDSDPVQRFVAAAKQLNITATKPRVATGTLASSTNLLLPSALQTGNLEIVPNAVAREITLDKNTGLVNGVAIVDRHSKREFHVRARVVIVGASTLESTRLLLNSKSRLYATGLANSSGVLGHYLYDQFYVKGVVHAIVPPSSASGRASGGGYIPQFRNVSKREDKFIRGYALEFSGGGAPPADTLPLYGEALLKRLGELNNSAFRMTTMGAVLPRFEHHVRIDPNTKDAWGIPALHITQRYTDNEHEMAKDSMNVAEQLCRSAGFELLTKHSQMVPPGESIHELGTCRMGANPKTSVLNGFNQAHDVKNLFVMDGSSFVTSGPQNPTLTIMALAMRASEHLAGELKARNL